MKISARKKTPFFQEGGSMPAQAPAGDPSQMQGAPAPEGGEGSDPIQQIIEAAAQAVQANDGQLALQVCQALVQMAQSGGGAPEQPVYRKGGELVRRR